ncbi:hypothetical protein PM082_010883 [Marasmius tenuissimus]|nr:hypothetical protein PM082_010883 [Marasmius tenuissimus]
MTAGDVGPSGLDTTAEAMDVEVPRYTAEEKGKGKARHIPEATTDLPNQAVQEEKGSVFGEDAHHPSASQPSSSKKRGRPRKNPISIPSAQIRSHQSADTRKQQVGVDDVVEVEGVAGTTTKSAKRGEKSQSSVKWLPPDGRKGKKPPQPVESVSLKAEETPESFEETSPDLTPPQWCSSRAELLLLHPELQGSSCVNGIVWGNLVNPVLLLDGQNKMSISSIRVEKDAKSGYELTIMDLDIARAFERSAKDSELSNGIPNESQCSRDDQPPAVFEPKVQGEIVLPSATVNAKPGRKGRGKACKGDDDQNMSLSVKHEQSDDPSVVLNDQITLTPNQNRRKASVSQRSNTLFIKKKQSGSNSTVPAVGVNTTPLDMEVEVSSLIVANDSQNGPLSLHSVIVSSPTQCATRKRQPPPEIEVNVTKKSRATEGVDPMMQTPGSSISTANQTRKLRPRNGVGIGTRTFVPSLEPSTSFRASRSRSTNAAVPRPQLRIDTQFYDDGLRMSPLSPLTPLKSPSPIPTTRRRRLKGSEPTRRSSRISALYIKAESEDDASYMVSRSGLKRRRGITGDSERPRNRRRRDEKHNDSAIPLQGLSLSESMVSAQQDPTAVKVEPVEVSLRPKGRPVKKPGAGSHKKTASSSSPHKAKPKKVEPSGKKEEVFAPRVSKSLVLMKSSKEVLKGLKFKKSPSLQPPTQQTTSILPRTSPAPITITSILETSTVTQTAPIVSLSTVRLPDQGQARKLVENSATSIVPGRRGDPANSPRDTTITVAPGTGTLTDASMLSNVTFAYQRAELPNDSSSMATVDQLVVEPPLPNFNMLDSVSQDQRSYVTSGNVPEPPQIPVPAELPSEVQALIRCQARNVPVFVIASREIFASKSGIRLASEHAYLYTGYWRLQDVKTCCVEDVKASTTLQSGSDRNVCGNVTWTFTCYWIPGRESLFDSLDQVQPWWLCDKLVIPGLYSNLVDPSMLMSDVKYDNERGEDQWGLGDGDGGSSKGWYCFDCGKLNRQTLWRRRKCSSQRCKDKPISACTVRSLEVVRDRGQQQPLFLPNNIVPSFIDPLVTDWEDGRRTFVYKTGLSEIKHVSTCNFPDVQEEQTELFASLQGNVLLRREPEDSRPYFSLAAAETSSGFSLANAYNAPTFTWNEVPPCVKQSKEMLSFLARYYGEVEYANITNLLLLAWTADGRRKADTPLQAKEQGIVLMALGHEIVVRVSPKSGLVRVNPQPTALEYQVLDCALPLNSEAGPSTSASGSGLEEAVVKAEPLENLLVLDELPELNPLPKVEVQEPEIVLAMQTAPTAPESIDTRSKRPKKVDKKEDNSLSFTIVHGDALILSGDDFEYTIHREGISILLIGILG